VVEASKCVLFRAQQGGQSNHWKAGVRGGDDDSYRCSQTVIFAGTGWTGQVRRRDGRDLMRLSGSGFGRLRENGPKRGGKLKLATQGCVLGRRAVFAHVLPQIRARQRRGAEVSKDKDIRRGILRTESRRPSRRAVGKFVSE
jgi:hypothetical protein